MAADAELALVEGSVVSRVSEGVMRICLSSVQPIVIRLPVVSASDCLCSLAPPRMRSLTGKPSGF